MKSCLICKFPFEKSNFKKFCSHKCFLTTSSKSKCSVVIDCSQCGEKVLKYKSQMCNYNFCDSVCAGNHSGMIKSEKAKFEVVCSYCDCIFHRPQSIINRKDRTNTEFFCSKKCKGCYDSTITKGIFDPNSSFVKKRSALELYIEEKIKLNFPYIKLAINNRSLLESRLEVDFYFPDLKLAIEVNGIVHYKAIYGEEAFIKIQEKDNRKIQLCEEKKIDLIIIKSTVRFYESVGEKIWNENIKPELLKRIPFCENKSENLNNIEINPIKKLLLKNSK
jgi:hypothetical protein